jgi:SNF2 family DNA or RNA helicase
LTFTSVAFVVTTILAGIRVSLEDEFKSINIEFERILREKQEADEKEAILNGQIAALRLQLEDLKTTRHSLNQRSRKVTLDKESIERKLEIERQTIAIQNQLDEKLAAAQEIIANAPWRDVAFDWQIEGAVKLPDRALLGDKRGLGKTLSSIIWRRVHGVKKTLVCLRREVASDFIKELSIREPNLFVYPMLSATSQERQFAAMLLNHHEEFVVVTNIESWRRDPEKTTDDILRIKYEGIILDEAHHIKNSGTGTAIGFFRLANAIPKLLELTGTPIKNRPQEMFSLLHALYPDMFPRESKFRFDFCMQVGQNKWVFTPSGLKTLVKMIEGFYLARTPEDIGRKVPPPRIIEYKLDFEAHPEQKQAYKLMTERNLAVLNSGQAIPIMSQLAIMTRQAQMVSWPAGIVFDLKDEWGQYVDTIRFDVHQSVKMDWAEDLISELVEEGERVLMFSRFKPAIYELRRRLVAAGLSVAVITGDEKAKGNTAEIFDDFDLKTAPEKPKYQVLLATYQTVGESANLNAARHMVLYDRFWNPGNEDQAIGRIDRINSTDQATVHIPLVEGSIDVYMTELIVEKRQIVQGFKEETDMQASLTKHLKETL